MKRKGKLYDRICEENNIYLAYTKSKKGKSGNVGVIRFEKDLQKNLEEIRSSLVSGDYRTSEYETFMIYDPKEREIYRLPFKDRVVG